MNWHADWEGLHFKQDFFQNIHFKGTDDIKQLNQINWLAISPLFLFHLGWFSSKHHIFMCAQIYETLSVLAVPQPKIFKGVIRRYYYSRAWTQYKSILILQSHHYHHFGQIKSSSGHLHKLSYTPVLIKYM